MSTTPLEDLPLDVRDALLRSGWQPGFSRMHSDRCKIAMHPLARIVLSELGGLKVKPIQKTGLFRPYSVEFFPDFAEGYEDEILEIEKRLKTRISPVANVGNGVAIMLLAETGHVLLLGYCSQGLLLAGSSFGEGMRATLAGEANRPVFFSDDPQKFFWNDQWDPQDASAYRPGYEGLAIEPRV